ncbi:alkylmercury lyase family protein [Streptomyces sp. LS1784]|uniref:alkylmercury lyase family protein n=1 Tax=Streptomyces sp. LS1784 TaxID=2851533 RepID=UPI001CCBF58B|nr:alkylmercury lyase family protein [Streptomyces sp. LS1784]
MRVEMLIVPHCPNGPVLRERLELALGGRTDVELAEHVVDDQAQAERWGMHGSPTLLVDGRDPFAEPGTAASVSCRLYRGADGRIDGAPAVEELQRMLGTAATGGADRAAGRSGRGRLAPAERGLRAVQQAVLQSFATTGSPPAAAELESAAEPFGVPAAEVLAELVAEDFLTLDDTGRVQAAYPFSAIPTEHTVEISAGPTVWSMCAIDALGIPVMLDTDAVITSTDPVTGENVRVEFAGGKSAWQPATAVVYYGVCPGNGPASTVCCGYLRFFTTRATAEQWSGRQVDLSGAVLDQAEAERLGADIFGPLLSAPAR